MAEYTALNDEQISAELKSTPGWELRDEWLRRTVSTPRWSHTLMLVNTIGYLAEAAYHHPDLNVGYAQVTVKLQTHKVRGITPLDFALARKIDEVALWHPTGGTPFDGYPKRWVKGENAK